MVDVAELNLRVQSDDVAKADQRLGRFIQTAARSERASARLAESARRFGRAFAVVGAAAAAAAADSLRLAVEAEETANKFRTVFRGSVEQADRQLIELSRTVPLTVSQLRGLAASTQDLLVPLGLARDAAADLSVQAVSLAGDIASFNNVGTEEVLRAIQSALAGSSEPMRRFGVDTRETRLQTLALNEGLVRQGEELTAAARGQAVFRAIVLDSADAVGDLERTQDSAANASRRLARDLRQVREDLGTALLPAFTELVSELGDTEDGMSDLESVARSLFLLIGRLAQGAILAAEGFSSLGRVIARVAGETRFFIDDVVNGGLFDDLGVAFGLEPEEVRRQRDAVREFREEFRAAFSEDFNESRNRFQRLFNQLGEGLDTFASGTQEALQETEELESGLKSLNDEAEKTSEAARKIAESMSDMNDEIADAAAELGGPLSEAAREFQKEAQRIGEAFREGNITQDQAVTRLEQLETQFQRTADVIRQDFLRAVDDALRRGLPGFVQQMIGLADATDRAAFGFARIGSGFAQSIFQGQDPVSALSSSLIGVGGQGLSDEFGRIFEGGFKQALENLGDPDTWKPSANGFALALGQALNGNEVQAAFTAAGSFFGAPGAAIGGILGSIASGLFDSSTPKFQVRGRNATSATDAGTDRVISTAFGVDLEIAFRDIEDQAKRQVVRGYSEFLDAISGIIDDPGQRSAIADVISRFGISSRSGPDDIEGQLELLFGDILQTFGAFTQSFVSEAATLDQQVQRLAEVLGIADQLADAADLLGRAFASSEVALQDFSAELLAAFDGDGSELSGLLDRVISGVFSDAELSEQTIRQARQTAADILTQLGIGINEYTFTADGARDLFDTFFGTLGAEGDVQLLQALDSIITLIDAEEELARIRGESADDLAKDWARAMQGIRDVLDSQLLGISSLTPQQRLNEAESQLREAVAAAQAGDLDAARDIPALFRQAIAEGAGFFGTSTGGFAAFESDLRQLLEGLDLGPQAVSVEEAQLQTLGDMLIESRSQTEYLEMLAARLGRDGITDPAIGPGPVPGPGPIPGPISPDPIIRPGRQSESVGLLEAIEARIEQGNEDRQRATEAQIEELSRIADHLQQQSRIAQRGGIQRPSASASRPAVVVGRQT